MKNKKETTKKKVIKTTSFKKIPKKVSRTVSKKPLTKKVVAKRKPSARIPKKPLVYAQDWQVFYAVNGAVLRSMNDLFNELETMMEDEYLYHKNSGDNFSVWVREVLGDDACASELSGADSKKKARIVLKRHLKFYAL
jgi:hypothetical protein